MSNDKTRLLVPKGSSGIAFGRKQWEANSDGIVEVEAEYADHLCKHGGCMLVPEQEGEGPTPNVEGSGQSPSATTQPTANAPAAKQGATSGKK